MISGGSFARSSRSLLPRLFGLAAVACLFASTALAQTTTPSTQPPALLEGGTEIERRLPAAPSRPSPPPPVVRPAPAEPAAPLGPETFVVAAIVIDGATVFEPAAFVPLYRDLLARPIGREDLAALAEAITALYYDAGYTLTRAFIPPQDIRAGIVTVRVAEGYIERVTIEGDGAEAPLLRSYADPIATERPLHRATLERQLLLMGELFGARVADARLRPLDAAAGRYELVLDVQHSAFDVYGSLDNRGTRSNGPLQLWTNLNANALGDSSWRAQGGFFTAPNSPQELLYGQLGLARIVGTDGLVLRSTVSASRNVAGTPQKSSDTETSSRRLLLGGSYPVLRERRQSLWANFTFDALHSREERFKRTSYEDELRVARPGLYYYLADNWGGETGINLETSFGLTVLGASPSGPERSRSDADTSFRKLRIDAWRAQELTGPWSLYGQAAAQLSEDALLVSEEFSLGGARYGRGYDPGLISGDRGAAAAVELRFTEPLEGPLTEYQLYGFYDVGRIANRSIDNDPQHRLASTGVGGRVRIGSAVRLNLELAKPLDAVEGREDREWRTFFGLTAEF